MPSGKRRFCDGQHAGAALFLIRTIIVYLAYRPLLERPKRVHLDLCVTLD